MFCNLLEDSRVVSVLSTARNELLQTESAVSISTLSEKTGLSVFSTIYAVSFHKQWKALGLDKDQECAGPHTAFH